MIKPHTDSQFKLASIAFQLGGLLERELNGGTNFKTKR